MSSLFKVLKINIAYTEKIINVPKTDVKVTFYKLTTNKIYCCLLHYTTF